MKACFFSYICFYECQNVWYWGIKKLGPWACSGSEPHWIIFFCVPSPTSQLLLFWCRTEQLEKATFFSSCCDQKNRFCFCVSPTELAWEQCGAGLPWWFEAQTKNDGKKEVASKNFARANAAGAWSTVVYDRLNWGYAKVDLLVLTKKLVLRSHAHIRGAAIDRTGNGLN